MCSFIKHAGSFEHRSHDPASTTKGAPVPPAPAWMRPSHSLSSPAARGPGVCSPCLNVCHFKTAIQVERRGTVFGDRVFFHSVWVLRDGLRFRVSRNFALPLRFLAASAFIRRGRTLCTGCYTLSFHLINVGVGGFLGRVFTLGETALPFFRAAGSFHVTHNFISGSASLPPFWCFGKVFRV